MTGRFPRLLSAGASATVIVLLALPAASAAIVPGSSITLHAPYSTGVAFVGFPSSSGASGCGASLNVSHAAAFALSTGRGSVDANASIASCAGARAAAVYYPTMGVNFSNLTHLTLNTTGGATLVLVWKISGWFNLSGFMPAGYSKFDVAESFAMWDTVHLWGGPHAPRYAFANVYLFGQTAHTTRASYHYQSLVSTVVLHVKGLNRTAAYHLSTSITVLVLVSTTNAVPVGAHAYASVEMLPGSLLSYVKITPR